MTHLKLVCNRPSEERKRHKPESQRLRVGQGYALNGRLDTDQHCGIVADYKLNLTNATVEYSHPSNQKRPMYFVWHDNAKHLSAQPAPHRHGDLTASTEDNQKPLANRALLQKSRLIEPQLIQRQGINSITVTPEYIIHFVTSAGAAKIGEIRLVDSSRFVTLKNGRTLPILCTDPADGPALFVSAGQQTPVFSDHFIQPADCTETHLLRRSITQHLPEKFNGDDVESITVLEHVTSYFMQKLVAPSQSIWTPILKPISWGWNVSVELREGEWKIRRKRIVEPYDIHNELQLPEWQAYLREQPIDQWKRAERNMDHPNTTQAFESK